MTPIIVSDFYKLGNVMSQLRMILGANLKFNKDSDYGLIKGSLKNIQFLMNENNLDEETIDQVSHAIKTLENTPIVDNKLAPREARLVLNKVQEWHGVLKFQLDYISCYNSEHDSILNIAKLETEGVESFFGQDVWLRLTPIAQHDFDASARCLLYSLPTASGIMALRGMEEVVRQFHTSLCVKNGQTNPPKTKTWGEVLKDLESFKVNQSILGYLRYMKNEMRNPFKSSGISSYPT